MQRPIKILLLKRKPAPVGHFSIENVFRDIQQAFPENINGILKVSKYESQGFFKRLYNCIEAVFWKGDIKHITGDVHYLAAFLNPKKTILTIHDCYILQLKKGLARKVIKYFWFTMPVKKCGHIVAISEATKKDIIKYTGCNESKITVIPDPAGNSYRPFPKEFNKDLPHVLHIGTKQNKNIERLIEAVKEIKCHLSIVGKLNEKHVGLLKKNKINYSNCYNISDEEMVRKYEEANVLAFVSTFEGFGLPIVEAQSVGRPVLTSNISSMPFVAGGAACLVDPFNVEEIRDGLKKIINDEGYRKELIKKGFENKKRFDAKTIAGQYAALYEKVVGAKNGKYICLKLMASIIGYAIGGCKLKRIFCLRLLINPLVLPAF